MTITHVLVAAKAINTGREIWSRNLYGFLLVRTKRRTGSATSIRKNKPQMTAAINMPRSRNTLDTSSMSATATRIKLSTPTGVAL